MSNVVSIGLPKKPNLSQRQGALMLSFACHRRPTDDVFWLKENAELLSILNTTKAKVSTNDLSVYRSFYDGLEEKFRFFPQYYRFLVSMCLDLEDLGFDGNTGVSLCERVAQDRLMSCELSDLQRAETQRLLARRGCNSEETALENRLRSFMEHTNTFALPNKKAAYELTHIVFYLSNYGEQPLALSEAASTSLEYTGLLAYLDQDIDLLAEVCLALRFCGKKPSEIWEEMLTAELRGFALVDRPTGPSNDAYHEYLVTSWWADTIGIEGFHGAKKTVGGVEVIRKTSRKGPLRAMSELMYQLGPARSGDWEKMRGILHRSIDREQQHVLEDAASSSHRFGAFFQGFSRIK
ncbi:MAG: hypothetical protein ABJQ70_09780 [Roseobacter sp.]